MHGRRGPRPRSALRRSALSAAPSAHANDVIVDLSELGFADPSLMIDLAMVAQRLRMRGRGMRLRGAQPHIRRLIEMVGLHRLPGVRIDDRAAPPARAEQLAYPVGTMLLLLLVLLFIVLPIAELYVIIQVGEADRRAGRRSRS